MMTKRNSILFAIVCLVVFVGSVFFFRKTDAPPGTAPSELFHGEDPLDVIVLDLKIKNIGNYIPSYLIPIPTDVGGLYELSRTPAALVITKKESGKTIEVPFEKDIEDTAVTWLTSGLILLIEKENAFRKIDRLYVVRAENGEKIFLAGSFPIVSRLNLDRNILVYNEGKEIVVTDNSGMYWQLSLQYK